MSGWFFLGSAGSLAANIGKRGLCLIVVGKKHILSE